MTSESMRSEASSISSEMLAEVRIGNEAAWRRMVNLYGPLVYHWSRCSGLQPNDAKEIVQDVFCAVFRGIQGFERTERHHSFRGWLRTITNNKIRDEARRRGRTPVLPGSGDQADDEAAMDVPLGEGAEQSIDAPTLALLARALDAVRSDFSDKTWQAFYRSTVQGHAAAEIADDLQMTPKAVRQAKYRVLLRLRSDLEPGF